MSKIFKDVVIFKPDADTVIIFSKDPLPVSFGFDRDNLIGMANLRVENGTVYADIEIAQDKEKYLGLFKNCHPYTGGIQSSFSYEIKETSIGMYPGADATLPDLNGYILAD